MPDFVETVLYALLAVMMVIGLVGIYRIVITGVSSLTGGAAG